LWLTVLIGDASGNNASARQREVDSIERLSVEELQIAAGLEGP
jgi:hypothetical protein